ncbi:MAG: C_GCAxxG_C_C family protein [Desulfobacterales bacterium]|nr:C_GCAxxG_C_C family protein [Desulfobacterales bacterium]
MLNFSKNEIQAASTRASQHFVSGYHCAEAVASAVLEALGEDAREAAAHATAFGGGFGRSFGEACGAISGGLIAIGHLHGRREPGGEWDIPAELGAELRSRFVKDFGTTHCGALRDRFGEESQMEECGKLVERVVGALLAPLVEKRGGALAPCCQRAHRETPMKRAA